MKNLSILAALLFLMIGCKKDEQNEQVNSTWKAQTSGTDNYLRSVFFIDANNGFAVGDAGTIIKTTNGGVTWTIDTTGANWSTKKMGGLVNWLNSVYFIDQTGYAVGSKGTILKTINSGNTWTPQPIDTNYYLYSVFFIDANNGFAVGTDGWSKGIILKTSNGGETWTNQIVNETTILNSVFFVGNTGYTAGGNIILKTTDKGTTWISKSSEQTNNFSINSIFFTDENTGYIVGSSDPNIHKTTDGGTTWSAQTSGTHTYLNSVYFTNANTGYIVGLSGTILKTLNGGNTWTLQKADTTNYVLESIYFAGNAGYVVGGWSTGGIIYKTIVEGN